MRSGDGYLQTTLRPRLQVDLGLTLWPLRRGTGDPSMRAERHGVWWRATRTPEGPATARYATRPGDGEVQVVAWGPGAEWCLANAPELLGARDHLDGFAPDGLVARLHHAMPGLRISRSRAVFEALVPSILEQKVAGIEARRSYRGIVLAWGTPAPGPAVPRPGGGAPRPLVLPPDPRTLAAKAYWQFHRFGVEMRRANVIRGAAAAAQRVDRTVGLPLAEAHRHLQSLPGVGPWTSAEVALVALGDADAVPVGDYHLPHVVSWALAGEPRGTDERMLELLEPYAGQRGRVIRLLARSGSWAPRFGPRMPTRSFNRI
jgi:3-methyladenine DNA glycosylase/8-oxoguanine DNA glycosylase